MTGNDGGAGGGGPASGEATRRRADASRRYDPDGDGGLAAAVVAAVADAEGVSPGEVTDPPLYEAVDVAGVEDALFGARTGGARQVTGAVEFRYRGHLVTVGSDGWVRVYGAGSGRP